MIKQLMIALVMFLSVFSFSANADSVLPSTEYKTDVWQANDIQTLAFPEYGMKQAFGQAFSNWEQCTWYEYRWYEAEQTGYAICNAMGHVPSHTPMTEAEILKNKSDADLKYLDVVEYRWIIPFYFTMQGEPSIGNPVYQVIWKDGTELTNVSDKPDATAFIFRKMDQNKMLEKSMTEVSIMMAYDYLWELYDAASKNK